MKTSISIKVSNAAIAIAFVAVQMLSVAALTVQSASAASPVPNGPVKRVIVTYKDVSGVPDGNNPELARDIIKYQKNKLMEEQTQTSGYKKIIRNLNNMPVSIMEVDAEGEASLKASDKVASVKDREYIRPQLKDTIPLIGGSTTTGFSDGTTNFTGQDQIVAIIDEGYNEPHLMLDGTFAAEACFSSATQEYTDATVSSACSGGATESFAAGSAQANAAANNHGTAVTSVVAGQPVTAGSDTYSGVAIDSKIVAIKVVAQVTEKAGYEICGDGVGTLSTCYIMLNDLILAALDHVIDLNISNELNKPIAAVNLSLGSTTEYHSTRSACDAADPAYVAPFAALRLANIAPVVAAGNAGDEAGNEEKVSSPACITGAVGVSSSVRDDTVAYYSNAGTITDIMAPGGDLSPSGDGGIVTAPTSSNSTTSYGPTQGTSFAAPIISGAYAVMREKNATLSVDSILRVFKETGVNVTENRAGYVATVHKRIQLDDALAAANDLPSITSLTPQGSSFVAGQNFNLAIVAPNAVSCSLVGGSATTSLSGGNGTITIPAVAGTQTYIIECEDGDGYAARQSVTLTASGSTGVPGSNNTGSNGQVLGSSVKTPNTGFRRFLQQNPLVTLAVTMTASLAIIYIARRREQLLNK